MEMTTKNTLLNEIEAIYKVTNDNIWKVSLDNIYKTNLHDLENNERDIDFLLKTLETEVNKKILDGKLKFDMKTSDLEIKIIDEYISIQVLKNYPHANNEFKMLVLYSISNILSVIWGIRRIQKVSSYYTRTFNYVEVTKLLDVSIKQACMSIIKHFESNGKENIKKVNIKNIENMYKKEKRFVIFDSENTKLFFEMDKLPSSSQASFEIEQNNSTRLMELIKEKNKEGIVLNVNDILIYEYDSFFQDSEGNKMPYISDKELRKKLDESINRNPELIIYQQIINADLKILAEKLGLDFNEMVENITEHEKNELVKLKSNIKTSLGYFNPRDTNKLLDILKNYRKFSDDFLQDYEKLSMAKEQIISKLQEYQQCGLKPKLMPVYDLEKIINTYISQNDEKAVSELVKSFKFSDLLDLNLQADRKEVQTILNKLLDFKLKLDEMTYSHLLKDWEKEFMSANKKSLLSLSDKMLNEAVILNDINKEFNDFNYEKFEKTLNNLVSKGIIKFSEILCLSYVENMFNYRYSKFKITKEFAKDLIENLKENKKSLLLLEQIIIINNPEKISFKLSGKGILEISKVFEIAFKKESKKPEEEKQNVFYNQACNLKNNKKSQERMIRLAKNISKIKDFDSKKINFKLSKKMDFRDITTQYFIIDFDGYVTYLNPNNHIIFEKGLVCYHKTTSDESNIILELDNTFSVILNSAKNSKMNEVELKKLMGILTIVKKSFDRRFKLVP